MYIHERRWNCVKKLISDCSESLLSDLLTYQLQLQDMMEYSSRLALMRSLPVCS